MLCFNPHFSCLRAASKCACRISRSLLAQPTTLLYGLKALNTLFIISSLSHTTQQNPRNYPAQEGKASLLRELQVNSPGRRRVLKQTPVRSSTLNQGRMFGVTPLPLAPKISVVLDHASEWVAVGPGDGLLELVEGHAANYCCDGNVETLAETLIHNLASARSRLLGIREKVQKSRRISTFFLVDNRFV